MPTMTEARDAIAAANRRFTEAFNRGEHAAGARAAYTRDARVMPPGAPMVEGREAIAQFWPGAARQLGVTHLALTTLEVRPLGDGACEIGRAALTMGDQRAEAKYVVIWRQEDGEWRMDVDIWNMDA